MDGSTFAPRNGREAREKGLTAERLFYEAFHNYPATLPLWFNKVERATHEEDAGGVDAWAYTTLGCIPVQVKSSACGARDYRRTHQDCGNVVTLVVSSVQTPTQIREMTIRALENHFTHLRRVRDCRNRRRTSRS